MAPSTDPNLFDHGRLAREVLGENPVLYQKIGASCNLERDAVPGILRELMRFLNLAAHSRCILTPSRAIDDAWHEFILCTHSYSEFCTRYFGRMIHHHPGGKAQTNRDQFQQTLAIYRDHFGDPDERFWLSPRVLETDVADCGGCET